MSSLAPVALFVYNRPELARDTLESLMANEYADRSDLFIFSDGARNQTDARRVNEVRRVIREKKWCGSVTMIESESNRGLAQSIITGVTEVVNQHGKIIVLEDDHLTSKYFLQYMNDALTFYRDVPEVISIHGYVYPVQEKLPEIFFLKGADCWGWATWKRGWELFEPDGEKLLSEIKKNNLGYAFDFDGSYPYLKMLTDQNEGKSDSWAIRWYASAFLKNKLTLYPGRSLVHNTGMGKDATHTKGKTESFDTGLANAPVKMQQIPVEVNRDAFESIRRFFKSVQPSLIQKLKQRLKWN